MRVLKIRYSERLRTIPQPGQGRHTALLSIANLGTLAGIDPEQIHQDIQRALSGGPSMSDGDIKAAISKAAAEHLAKDVHYRIPLKPRPIITSGQVALRRIIDQGAISEDVDFWEAS